VFYVPTNNLNEIAHFYETWQVNKTLGTLLYNRYFQDSVAGAIFNVGS
jgi:hypothetical protein